MISDNHGGGNCMFHALSEQLDLMKGIKISHQELRHNVVNYLKNNPKLVSSSVSRCFKFSALVLKHCGEILFTIQLDLKAKFFIQY